jgi:peptidoglycan/xylan/chitin deacetylase (PgdA/CDA1 family)
MLNYTNTKRIFGALLLIVIGMDVYYSIPVFIYLALYLAYSALFFYGVFNIDANFFMVSFCSKPICDKAIAISFDDGPGLYTLEILQILKEQGITAAFFCIGKQIKTKEHIVRQIHQQGHLIGNHSYSHHLLFDFFSSSKMLKDIQRMESVTNELIGLKPKLFRPPFGVTVPWLKTALTEGGYLSIGWNVRSLDTVTTNENKLMKKIIHALNPGALYLFHDTSKTTLAVLPQFIEQVAQQGYRIVRLDELLNLPAYK